MIETYQRNVLSPNATVDYASEMMQRYRPENLQCEPMIGLRVLLKDLNARVTDPKTRLSQIDAYMGVNANCGGVLRGTGCILRETMPNEMQDGLWLITFPVPTSVLMQILSNMSNVLTFMRENLGIESTEVIEINASGRCPVAEEGNRLGMVQIVPPYNMVLAPPNNSPYKIGHITRINDMFALLRTRWDWSKFRVPGKIDYHVNDIMLLSQLMVNMFVR